MEAIEMKQRRADKLVELKEQAQVQLMETRSNLLRQAIEHMQYADLIRNLISAIKDKAVGRGGSSELDKWAAWAVEQADKKDPRAKSREAAEAWIQKFRLT